MARFCVILPAAGASRRFGDRHTKKQYASLEGRAVWLHTAERFLNRPDVVQTILVIAPEDKELFQGKFAPDVAFLGIRVVTGGATRAESVRRGLEQVPEEATHVCIHDAVRPCLAETWVDRVFQKAEQTGAAVLAVPVADTLKRVEDQRVLQTVSREGLWAAQTPQVFEKQLLLDAYARLEDQQVTDDAQVVELAGGEVHVVQGSPLNLKITTRDDLKLAQAVLKVLPRLRPQGPAHPFAGDELWR